ncbi:MAG TPA: hypothetical protein VF141_22855 [Chryseolinea sp.]
MQFRIQIIIMALCLVFNGVVAQPPSKIVPGDWNVFSENYDPTTLKDTVFQGKPSIKLDGKKMAVAFRKGARYKNVRIECDIAGRVMSGIGFRAKDQQNYHFLYFRTGAGGTKEAIQYVPIYNGALSWVHYNYPTYEKSADIQSMQWFHAAIEIRGSLLKVYVNNSKEPQMEINLIESDFDEGDILLRSMFGETYFANVMIYELPDILADWQLSEQFPRKETLDLDPATKSSRWIKVKPDAANIINISRYIEDPNGVVIAKHSLKSDADKDKVLYFDFIGRLKIFLNGREVFHYEKHKVERIFPATERILLHLKRGENELVFLSEGDANLFGKGFNSMGRAQHQNWGFIAEVGNR